MLSSLYKQRKPNRFQYTPRYYDEVKEDIENRKNQIQLNIKQQIEKGIQPTLDQVSLTKGFLSQERKNQRKYKINPFWIIYGGINILLYFVYHSSYVIIPLSLPIIYKSFTGNRRFR